MSNLTSEQVEYLIQRLLDNAAYAKKQRDEDNSDENNQYYAGLMQGYYEMLDTLKNQLVIDDQDLKEFGLDINLEEELV